MASKEEKLYPAMIGLEGCFRRIHIGGWEYL